MKKINISVVGALGRMGRLLVKQILKDKKFKHITFKKATVAEYEQKYGYDLSKYKGIDKRVLLRNCVSPEVGKYILDEALND